jgi:serine/threonine protein kinase
MTTPDDGKAFLQVCLAKRLIDKDQAREIWQKAKDSGRPPQQILIDMGLMAAPTVEAMEKEVRRALEPRIIGGFRLIRPIGQGGMARVFLAEQVSLGREVALKLMSPHIANDADATERFLREARTAATVNHPNVVSIIDVGRADGQLYMALELVTGGDAAQLAQRAGGLLPEAQALALLIDCANGLQALHDARLMHRDLKPSNIFITGSGSAKLGDLGLARSADDADRMTMTGHLVGTPAFMSPEQANASKDLDIRSDIYALGATLFALVTGRQPFEGNGPIAIAAKVLTTPLPDPRLFAPHLSAATTTVIQCAMAKDPSARYSTPNALRDALVAAMAEVPTVTPSAQYRNRSRVATAVFHATSALSNETASTKSLPGRRVTSRAVRRKPLPAYLPVVIAAGAVLLIGVVVALMTLTGSPRASTVAPATAVAAGPSVTPPKSSSSTTPPSLAVVDPPATPADTGAPAAPPAGAKPAPPTWATTHGVDRFGHWAVLRVDQAEQRLRWIPPGTCRIGVPPGLPGRLGMEDQAEVHFTIGVWLADTECTQLLYRSVIGANPSLTKGDDLPVTHVTFDEAIAFTRALGKQLNGASARLPSRAEWERACRADATTLFATGEETASLAGYANLSDVDRAKATFSKAVYSFSDGFVDLAPVARFKANRWGFYDMHGNVCEYCLGEFGSLRGDLRDPMTAQDGNHIGLIKGGSFFSEDTVKARCGSLPHIGVKARNHDIGFRFLIEASR